MQRLEQRQEGKYLRDGIEVIPTLVYGPILYSYPLIIDELDFPIDQLLTKVKSETGVDLEEIANSYTSGGLTIIESSTKRTRHEFVCFYDSKPKPCN